MSYQGKENNMKKQNNMKKKSYQAIDTSRFGFYDLYTLMKKLTDV